MAKLRSLDLTAVGRAHGVKNIGKQQTPFEQIHLPIELQGMGGEVFGGKTQLPKLCAREESRIAEVVNGKYGPDLLEGRMMGQLGIQIDEGRRRLPIIAVENLRVPIQPFWKLQHRPAEGRKSLEIIGEVYALLLIQPRSAKETVIGQEKHLDGGVRQVARPECKRIVLPGESNRKITPPNELPSSLRNDRILGHDHLNIMPQLGQG